MLSILLVACVAVGLANVGCTIIRYRDRPGGGGGGGGGGEPDPKVVDLLVQVDLQRTTANLTEDYGVILQHLAKQLAKNKVQIRKAALAPMYRRSGGVVPLLYGEGAENSDFGSLPEAVRFYTRDDGAEYLRDEASSDGENLAALGMQLDQRSIYHPKSANPDARAYFSEPADGLLVVSLSASERRCGAKEEACKLDGTKPGKFFTRSDGKTASWLELPGGTGLPPSKIYFASIVTAEGVSYSEFSDNCRSQPKFPKTRLDVMESSEKAFFGPFSKQVRNSGGNAKMIDLCRAMSSQGESVMKELAGNVRKML